MGSWLRSERGVWAKEVALKVGMGRLAMEGKLLHPQAEGLPVYAGDDAHGHERIADEVA
jgi:hypothetical protein